MEIFSVVNSDGTVSIPKEILETYGIAAGAKVDCLINGRQLEMRIMGTKLPSPKTKLVSGYGMVKVNGPSVSVDFDAAELFQNDRSGY
ncbi:hypothetical protein GTP58_19210 [Duganella sp. CY15W]|uniref:AbrB/MazE/SpoVT family DNA-binding domain-containing protein n=1 Tax=Duganella sp. CY15W TaxID=2692172 RepID=UPI00136B0C17|nr:AbrB/MazE/SpoVT family DNA-binding domain-containing protein [Duganella sp. CY15W]MYM30465.1 hypothetical protein [Duganella sp. CY15W]